MCMESVRGMAKNGEFGTDCGVTMAAITGGGDPSIGIRCKEERGVVGAVRDKGPKLGTMDNEEPGICEGI
jgi:hypothetical protein